MFYSTLCFYMLPTIYIIATAIRGFIGFSNRITFNLDFKAQDSIFKYALLLTGCSMPSSAAADLSRFSNRICNKRSLLAEIRVLRHGPLDVKKIITALMLVLGERRSDLAVGLSGLDTVASHRHSFTVTGNSHECYMNYDCYLRWLSAICRKCSSHRFLWELHFLHIAESHRR